MVNHCGGRDILVILMLTPRESANVVIGRLPNIKDPPSQNVYFQVIQLYTKKIIILSSLKQESILRVYLFRFYMFSFVTMETAPGEGCRMSQQYLRAQIYRKMRTCISFI